MKEFHVGVAFDRKEMKLHVEVAKRQIEPTEQELFAKQPNPVFIEKKDKNKIQKYARSGVPQSRRTPSFLV